MAQIEIDESRQLVRAIQLEDVQLTIDDVRRFNAELAKAVDLASMRYGKIRILVDSSKLSIQPPEVAQIFDRPELLLRRPEDRYAVVVGSNLAKLQARRVSGYDERWRMFLSVEAAEAWLLDNALDEGEEQERIGRSSRGEDQRAPNGMT